MKELGSADTTQGNSYVEQTINIEIKKKHWSEFLIVSQSNIVYQQFSLFLAFLTIFSTMMYANFAAFRIDVESSHGHSHNEMRFYDKNESEIMLFRYLTVSVESIYLIDFIT